MNIALCTTPMVIVYKVSWPIDWLLKRLVTTPHIGLVNVGAGKRISPELIQGQASAAAICREAAALLENRTLAQRTKRKLQDVRRALEKDGGVEKLAALVREIAGTPRTR